MKEELDWKQELLRICTILKNSGIDISNIQSRKTVDGKRCYVTIKDIKSENINIDDIIKTNELDGNCEIGKYIKNFRSIYNGTTNNNRLSDEQKRIAEELGIVKKPQKDRQKPLVKGGKISSFHVDIVKENLDGILNGDIKIRDIIKLINERAATANETEIKDSESINKIVRMLLINDPEKVKKYNKDDSPKGKIYYHEVSEFREKIIDHYLPLYLSKEITLEEIAKKLKMSSKTVNKIIEEYYININDSKGLENYEKVKDSNKGVVKKEIKEKAENMRMEILGYKIVSSKEFPLLPEEEQDKQIIMKIRKIKLKEERSEKNKENGRTQLITEEATAKYIERVKDYFRKKNTPEKENFSEQDIRNILFSYPTIINRSNETLDEKVENLLSHEDISEDNVYNIIKTFPAILGYSVQRTKEQLDILKSENLIQAVIDNPRRLMESPELIYSLIQYAKERCNTDDLNNLKFSNIFMANSTMKKLYGISHENIKNKFQYNGLREDDRCDVNSQTIGKASFNSSEEMCQQAQCILHNIIESIKDRRAVTNE